MTFLLEMVNFDYNFLCPTGQVPNLFKMKKIVLLLLAFSIVYTASAVEDYEIKVTIKNYEQDKLILAHYLGSNILVDDTASIGNDGTFMFDGEKKLAEGIYLLVMPPNNQFIEIFITEEEKNYSLSFDATTLTKDMVFQNAPDNTLFYGYLNFMGQTRPEMEALIKTIQEGQEAKKAVEKEEKALEMLKEKLENYKTEIIEKHPEKLTTTILKSNQRVDIPKFEGEERDVRMKEYIYRRTHFFDHVRADPRFFRTKICNDMINFYMENLTVPQPDSIIKSVDEVLKLVAPDSVAFKTYFLKYLNQYYASEYIGQDAVFVHLVKEYTLKGKSKFLGEETVAKITTDALLWDKTLIGKTAPDLENYILDIEGSIKVKDAEDENRRFALNGKTFLNSVFKPYTVVLFWAPDCGHCKKSMPVLVDFYEKHADSVEVFAVCHTSFQQFGDCAQALKDYDAIKWINTVDPYFKYIKDYSIETTPLILLLDQDKKVLFKKIGADKLETAIEQIEMQKKEQEK